jgi:hypothetical protein
MAHRAEIVTDFYCAASFCAVTHSALTNSLLCPIAHNQIHRRGPEQLTKFTAVAQCAKPNSPQWPPARKELEGHLSRYIQTALDHQLGTFGESL